MKAGVGGQRGTGLHAKWVKEQQQKNKKPMLQVDGPQPSPGPDGVPLSSPSDTFSDSMGQLSISSASEAESSTGGEDTSMDSSTRGGTHGSGSSGSYASTNSSFLTKYFPKRYFILKSLTQYDLDLSVEKGLWATQKHNEGILDKAFRTSQEVYLIFGVNKSGEFYGYAKMAGQIHKGEERVSWASRPQDTLSPRSTVSSPLANRATPNEDGQSTTSSDVYSPGRFFTPSSTRVVMDSPSPVPQPGPDYTGSHVPSHSLQQQAAHQRHAQNYLQRQRENTAPLVHNPAPTTPQPQDTVTVPDASVPPRPTLAGADSAPAALGPHRKLTVSTPGSGQSLDHWAGRSRTSIVMDRPESIELHLPESHHRAFSDKDREGAKQQEDHVEEEEKGSSEPWTGATRSSKSMLKPVSEEDDDDEHLPDGDLSSQQVDGAAPAPTSDKLNVAVPGAKTDAEWGESFRIEWIRTTRLPFHRTKHLRNPWNHDREIKVSRDGTELEPSVGQALLEEWDRVPQTDGMVDGDDSAGEPTSPGAGGRRGGASSRSLRP
jgi:hypothetical protein